MSNPRVSVIIPTYNRVKFVQDAIDSALAQTYPPSEVIVVDDGSTDGTPDVLASYGTDIRVIVQANAGSSAARNAALAVAGGDFVAWLDSDDAWHPEKLARQVSVAARWPEAALIHTRCLTMDEAGRTLAAEDWTEQDGMEGDALEKDALERMIVYCYPNTSSCLVRRSLVAEVGGFNPDWIFAEDWELNLRLAARAPFAYVATPLTRYRVHSASKTADLFPHAVGQVCLRRSIERQKGQWLSTHNTPRMRRSLRRHQQEYAAACGHLAKMLRGRGDVPGARALFWEALLVQPLVFRHWTRLAGAGVTPSRRPPIVQEMPSP